MREGGTQIPPAGRVRRASDVHVGDLVLYTYKANKNPWSYDVRSQIRVSRIEGGDVHGYREHPQDWEREIEFMIVQKQIEVGGLTVLECVEAP